MQIEYVSDPQPNDEPSGVAQVAIALGVVLLLVASAIAPAVVIATWRALL